MDGSIVYYGDDGSGSFGVQAQAADATSRLAAITFPNVFSGDDGDTYPHLGAEQATENHPYTFDSGDDFAGTVTVQATDQAGNPSTGSGQVPGEGSFEITRDATAPTINLTAAVDGDGDIDISWSTSDAGAGVDACTLTMSKNGAQPVDLSNACTGSHTYSDPNIEEGHEFTFHLAATDRACGIPPQGGQPRRRHHHPDL